MRILLAILLAFTLSGCFTAMELDKKWRPLETIVDRPWPDGMLMTIGTTVYVADSAEWLKRNPVGSPRFDSTMLHEQIHSIRQKKKGLISWIFKYLTDQRFRWREEQLGWYVEIVELKRRGKKISSEKMVKSLNRYFPRLAPKNVLKRWVENVLAGRWKPEPGELKGEDL